MRLGSFYSTVEKLAYGPEYNTGTAAYLRRFPSSDIFINPRAYTHHNPKGRMPVRESVLRGLKSYIVNRAARLEFYTDILSKQQSSQNKSHWN